MGRMITSHLWEHYVSEDCACAHEDEEDEVEEEYTKRGNLERQAVVVVRKVVQKGRDGARAHDNSMPCPSEMTVERSLAWYSLGNDVRGEAVTGGDLESDTHRRGQ